MNNKPWKHSASRQSGRKPLISLMDFETIVTNVRDGKLYFLKESENGIKELVEVNGGTPGGGEYHLRGHQADSDLDHLPVEDPEKKGKFLYSDPVTGAITFTDIQSDSHNHDDRYYTKVISDQRYPVLENGLIPSGYLPSYVDDVLEFANIEAFPAQGENGKIYVALDSNLTYRWSGSGYVEISKSLALGETSQTAYRGDRGKIAYDHSQIPGGTGVHISDIERTNWNAAFGWGNHAGLYVPITTYTAADVLAKLLTVDGSGSGLDADLLDGNHGAYYLDYNNLVNTPVSFPPSPHNHDDRYFTEAESDNRYPVLVGGLIPNLYLPSFVDDVIEYANFAALPAQGEAGKIYVILDTNLTYRWSGTAYVEISASLALGETSSTAYRGDRGKIAYDHSQIPGGTGVHVSNTERTNWNASYGWGNHAGLYVPLATYTAADILTKLKTVDGAGSGLDADLLDGQNSSYFAPIANLSGTLNFVPKFASANSIGNSMLKFSTLNDLDFTSVYSNKKVLVTSGIVNDLLLAHKRYTVAATLGGVNIDASYFLDGRTNSAYTFNPNTATYPLIITITGLPSCHPSFHKLFMLGWRDNITDINSNNGITLTNYTIEILGRDDDIWYTVANYAGVAHTMPYTWDLNGAGSFYFDGIRITINGVAAATWDANLAYITEIGLRNTAGAPAWDSVGALGIGGGNLYGSLTTTDGLYASLVGIGTTNLGTTKLTVYKSGSDTIANFEASGTTGYMTFKEAGSIRGYFGYGDSGHLFTGALTDSLSIRAQAALHLGALGNNLQMTLDGTNVGIGKTAPSTKLDVYGDATFGQSVTSTRRARFDTSGRLTLKYDDDSLSQTPLTLENLNSSAGILHGLRMTWQFGRTGDNVTPIIGGAIHVGKEIEWTTTSATNDSFMAFHTTLNSSLSERMRVNSDGNVGINNTAPSGRLDVIKTTGTPSTINIADAGIVVRDDSAVAAGIGGTISFTAKYSGNSYLNASPYIRAYKENAIDGEYGFGLKFGTRPHGSSQVVALTISGNGTASFLNTPNVGGVNVSLVNHNHDDLYYTESESDARFAAIVHNHDDRYFTEAESDNRYPVLVGGLIPSMYLPGYVDDVIEVANNPSLPAQGETGKIYVTLDDNKTYRWSGSYYVEISASLALGETAATAYRGDRGKIAYDHAQIPGGTGVHISDLERTNWNAAFGWGNHAGLYQPIDSDLTAIAALNTTGYLRRTGAGAWQLDATAGGDNYEGWNVLVDTSSMGFIPSKNSATTYAGGINFQSGNGITIVPSSIVGNKLQLRIDSYLSNNSSTLTANVAFTANNTYYSIRTLTLSAGTWLIIADVVLGFATKPSTAFLKIHNGATNYASTVISDIDTATYHAGHLHCIQYFDQSTTITLSGSATTVGCTAYAAVNNGNTATKLIAIKIQG